MNRRLQPTVNGALVDGSVCEPYPFSTDDWSPESVGMLRARFAEQTMPRHKATGVVIGSGGLPYILSHLDVSRVVVVDLHREVIDRTLWRASLLQGHDSWDTYYEEVLDGLQHFDEQIQYGLEVKRAQKSGLLGDFALTKAGLSRTELVGACGDIRQMAPALGSQLRSEGRRVTFVNLTNVALYAASGGPDYSRERGMQIVGESISHLPLADEAVILDSSRTYIPVAYSAEGYPGVQDVVPV